MYLPPINGTTTADLTNFETVTGKKVVAADVEPCDTSLVNGECPAGHLLDTVRNWHQTSTGEFSYSYDFTGVNAASGNRWAVSTITFAGDAAHLSQLLDLTSRDLVLDVTVTGGADYYKVDLIDLEGQKVTIKVNLVSGKIAITATKIADAAVANFDINKIKSIAIVIDDPDAVTGAVTVKTAGLVFVPEINAATSDDLTDFASLGSPAEVEPCDADLVSGKCPDGHLLDTIRNWSQTSTSGYSYQYDFSTAPAAFHWGASSITMQGDATHLNQLFNLQTSDLVLQVNVTGGASYYKVDLVDLEGDKVTVRVNVTNGKIKIDNNLVQTAGVTAFNSSQIKVIVIVVDDKNAVTGNVSVTADGLKYEPPLPGGTYDATKITILPGSPDLATLIGHAGDTGSTNGTIVYDQLSSSQFHYDYTNVDNDDFEVMQIAWGYWDQAQNTFIGAPQNLPQATFAFKGPAGTYFGIEFYDKNNHTFEVERLVMTGDYQNFTFDLTTFPDFDETQVGFINFVTDLGRSGASGRIDIQTGGLNTLPILPVISGQTYNPSAITTLTGNPGISAFGGNPSTGSPVGTVGIEQPNFGEYYFESHLPHDGSFTFAAVSNGYFDNSGTFVGTLLTISGNQLVMAIQGSQNDRVKVEVFDSAKNKAVYLLTLQPYYQNFVIDLNAPVAVFDKNNNQVPVANFNKNAIAQITLVQDHALLQKKSDSVIKFMLNGVSFEPPILDADLFQARTAYINAGLSFYSLGRGIDPVSHLPFDKTDTSGNVTSDGRHTQPTSIGFYLQMLSDAAAGNFTWGSRTKDELLTELNTVITNLRSVQDSSAAWHGLLPWLDLSNPGTITRWGNTDIGLGDNANLSQSIAVMMGALEGGTWTTAQNSLVQSIISKADTFLNNQQAGYQKLVRNGLFAGGWDPDIADNQNGYLNYNMDRLMSEFRGAIAFLQVRYTNIPRSVWDGLSAAPVTYTASDGTAIQNLQSFDGSAFQYFWPLLRNDERDYVGFGNALYNIFISQADFASSHNIPGFLSAAQSVTDGYVGHVGLPAVAETDELLNVTLGSTYALASAFRVHRDEALKWLNALWRQIPALIGTYGIADAAYSKDQVSQNYLAIDNASVVLGIAGKGPEDFRRYLMNRGLADEYGQLYDDTSKKIQGYVPRPALPIPPPPQPFERLVPTFEHVASESVTGGIVSPATTTQGTRVTYSSLPAQATKTWVLDQAYDVRGNTLSVLYTASNSPQKMRIEFLNAAGQVTYQSVLTLTQGTSIEEIELVLPSDGTVQAVKSIRLVFDPVLGSDSNANFVIHALNFQGGLAPIDLAPDARFKSGNVYTLPKHPVVSSSGNTTSLTTSSTGLTMSYNISSGGSATAVLDFDSDGDGQGLDASAAARIILGAQSSTVGRPKMILHDGSGHTLVFSLTNTLATSQYYAMIFPPEFDRTNILKMEFVVDSGTINPGGEVGTLNVELKGI